jgi:nucleoside-diphosphate-sugar epimerase
VAKEPKMRVCVTGALGYIGASVVQKLKEEGHSVVLVDNMTYAEDFVSEDDFYNEDVNSDSMSDLIRFGDFDWIVHLAALVGDGACAIWPELTQKVNVDSVSRICKAIKQYSPGTKLIFASTCSVYGASADDSDLTIDSPTNPLSLYAKTKLEAEKIIEDTLTNYVIYRLGTVYGLSVPGGRIRTDLVANVMTYRAVDNEPLQVFGGVQWRPMIHVRDVAAEMVSGVSGKHYKHKINILATKNYRIGDMAKEIVEALKSKSPIIETEAKFEDLRNYRVAIKHDEAFGRITFPNGVREMAIAYSTGRIKNPWIKRYNNAQFLKDLYGTR